MNYPALPKVAVALIVLVLIVILAGCGGPPPGYATPQEGCDAEGSGALVLGKSGQPKVVKETDEIEYMCYVQEGGRIAVVIEQTREHEAENRPNSFYADEDNLVDLATGQEIAREGFDPSDYYESDE